MERNQLKKIMSLLSYDDYMKAHPNAKLKVVALTPEASQVSIPMRKGAETENLRKAIDEAIIKLQQSGELKAVSEKYFGKDISGLQTK